MKELKKLFVRTDDFAEMIRGGYYYVDKTMLIKELIDKPSKVVLFTRPRRFGKSMNLLMLKAYFENVKGNETLFQELKIGHSGEQYLSEQGKYPIIYFTFKDIKTNSWQEMYALLSEQIRSEYLRHIELGHFDQLNQYRMTDVKDYLNRTATKAQMTKALENLTLLLHQTTGERPFILIDEYDAPLMHAKEKGYGEEALPFIRNFLSAGMKTNEHMSRAILTGVMRIAQADIFSGFNNVDVETVLDNDFSTQFGFTQDDVESIVGYYGLQGQLGKSVVCNE